MGALLTIVWSVLSRAGGVVWTVLSQVPMVAWLVLVVALWGWRANSRLAENKAAAEQERARVQVEQTVASERARTTERTLASKVQEISDELQRTTEERNTAVRLAADRLRQRAHAPASARVAATRTTCQGYEGPAVHVIRDETRDALVHLFGEADEVADQLRSCQAYVRDVVKPGEPAQP